MTDEEYFWEPVPSCWSVRRRADGPGPPVFCEEAPASTPGRNRIRVGSGRHGVPAGTVRGEMVQVMAAAAAVGAGHARYTYRLRLSSSAGTGLAAEWDRCRWVWNECVAKARAVHLHNKATGQQATCGPAQLDRMLTEARARTPWLRAGSSVVQQQIIRDFGRSRAKAHKDLTARLPLARRAQMPKWKTKREALATLNYTKRGFRLKDGRLYLAGGIVVAGVVAGAAGRAVLGTRVPGQPRTLVRLVRRARPAPAPAQDRPGARRGLGREGDRDHHLRRTRPPTPGTAGRPRRS